MERYIKMEDGIREGRRKQQIEKKEEEEKDRGGRGKMRKSETE